MGSLAKRIGQLSAHSMESESSQILRTIQSNKVPNSLSQRLDTTLKDSHDMKVFGLGTLSSLANVQRYGRFTFAMYGVYTAMEEQLDASSCTCEAIRYFWKDRNHRAVLRRSEKLKHDLNVIGIDESKLHSMKQSPATQQYIQSIQDAGRYHGGRNLLGHAYTRYLADLMGGQVLGYPTKLALGLEKDVQQYSFDFDFLTQAIRSGAGETLEGASMTRKEYVEKIYYDLNIAGNLLVNKTEQSKNGKDHLSTTTTITTTTTSSSANNPILEGIVDEARLAFRHNIEVYAEEPIYYDSAIGLKNIVSGYLFGK